jgi:predicted ArsR family transcriptional regulator
VRRAGQADAARLAGELGIGERAARELLDRMEASGVIGAPDMFGTRLVLAREVGHG